MTSRRVRLQEVSASPNARTRLNNCSERDSEHSSDSSFQTPKLDSSHIDRGATVPHSKRASHESLYGTQNRELRANVPVSAHCERTWKASTDSQHSLGVQMHTCNILPNQPNKDGGVHLQHDEEEHESPLPAPYLERTSTMGLQCNDSDTGRITRLITRLLTGIVKDPVPVGEEAADRGEIFQPHFPRLCYGLPALASYIHTSINLLLRVLSSPHRVPFEHHLRSNIIAFDHFAEQALTTATLRPRERQKIQHELSHIRAILEHASSSTVENLVNLQRALPLTPSDARELELQQEFTHGYRIHGGFSQNYADPDPQLNNQEPRCGHCPPDVVSGQFEHLSLSLNRPLQQEPHPGYSPPRDEALLQHLESEYDEYDCAYDDAADTDFSQHELDIYDLHIDDLDIDEAYEDA